MNFRSKMGLIGLLAAACGDANGADSGADGAGGSPGGGGAGATSAGGTGAGGGAGAVGSGGSAGLASGGGAGVSAGGSGAAASGGAPGQPSFTRHTVDTLPGAAWTAVADFDGDKKLDIVVSAFGVFGLSVPNGQVKLYRQGASVASWSGASIVSEADAVKFPNATTLVDLDGDGDLDVLLPVGFLACSAMPGGQPCGGLFWYEQIGGSWKQHVIVPNGSALFYHHAEVVDFDGDGILDLVTTGEQKGALFPASPDRAEVQWFKGTTGANRFESVPRVIGQGLGSLPTVRDLDGDGDLDVVSAELFVKDGSFAWMERTAAPSASNPAGTFVRHVIDAQSGPSIQLRLVDDLYGDGKLRAVGTNHTNTGKVPADPWPEAVFVFDIPPDPKQPWPKKVISQGIKSAPGSMFAPQGAPGIFDYGDVDGDGDIDLVVAGDGDPRVFWLEQTATGWQTHVLEEKLAQAGGLQVVDLDGDGKNEIVVTGYEANAVYVYVRN
jgi:hypothetical protein